MPIQYVLNEKRTAPVFKLPLFNEWVTFTPEEQDIVANISLSFTPETMKLARLWAETTFPEKEVASYQLWHAIQNFQENSVDGKVEGLPFTSLLLLQLVG